MKTFIKNEWPFLAIIAMLVWLVAMLSLQLKTSRSNERELSKRQAVLVGAKVKP